MALKYVEKRYIFIFVILSFFKSLQAAFIAVVSQQMVNWVINLSLVIYSL